MSNSLIDELFNFLSQSPTAWHAVHSIKNILSVAGFAELHESDEWVLEKGKAYFITRDGSSLCAFVTPSENITRAHILASHLDSPGFKLKPNPEFRRENMTLLASEIYGGPLLTSWFNRDLGIAGRVFFADKDHKIGNKLIDVDDKPVTIPQLAIHLDRDANEKGPTFNKQDHFSALAALDFDPQKSYLLELLHEKIGEPFEYILSHDLFLYPLEKPRLLSSDMIAAYRLDSLASVHAALSALKTSIPHKNHLNMAIFWNHEEIGSKSAHGAESPFLLNILERLSIAFEYSREQFLRMLPQSLCLSIDLIHAVNPNYPEKHDSRHLPFLNKGPVIKYNAQQRYASDASSSAYIIQLCERHVIPYQFFSARNDAVSGTTIGPVSSARTGIPTVDMGSPQLSMHSCRELIAAQDHLEMCRLLSAFLQD
jgi:aspartyl aminopeptidase